MHPVQLRAAIGYDGRSRVSRTTGLPETVVNAVLDGRARCEPIEQAIADVSGIPLHELWPQWYAAAAAGSSPKTLSERADAIEAVLLEIRSSIAEIQHQLAATDRSTTHA